MKNKLEQIIFGKSSLSNGLIALIIVGLIALGCTCNDKNFSFGTNKDSNITDNQDDIPPTPEEKKISKSDASKGELPSDEEMEAIIKDTLLEFDKAVKNEDFTEFYNQSSEPFQESISPRRMKTKFQKFIDGNADISGIEDLEPKYTLGPKIKKQGKYHLLEANGEFETKPRPSKFELKYINEGEDWKVISIQVITTIYNKR